MENGLYVGKSIQCVAIVSKDNVQFIDGASRTSYLRATDPGTKLPSEFERVAGLEDLDKALRTLRRDK